jgi:hypothetical protein
MTTFSFSLPALERAQSQDFEVEIMFCHHCDDSLAGHRSVQSSVADPDPNADPVPDPLVRVWIRIRIRLGTFCHQAKNVRKPLIPTVLRLLFDFLSLKMM